ncbi:MAG: CHAD domain-containing protein [Sphingobium sp.]
MDMVDEIELKLELSPEGIDALEASGLLPGEAATAQQRSIYFDTADHDLADAGFSLRIRKTDRKRIQTVKAASTSAGLYVRPEWERPVKDDAPILDDTTPIRALLGDKTDSIAPLFEVHIERRVWMLGGDDATIELALDRGEAIAGERLSPIREIELELKQGAPDALFALARRIDEAAPARIGVLTKAERGYRLTGPSPTLVKAEPVALTPDMTAAQAFQAIAGNCLRQFRLNETLLLDRRNAGALHQARVALRRLRSALTIFRPVIGEESREKPGQDLRWLASELGDARNLDVLLDRVGEGPLQDHISAAREAAYDKVAESLSAPQTRAMMLDFAQWLATGPWLTAPETEEARRLPVRDFAVTALDRLRRRVKKDGRHLDRADDEARHTLRKDAKKLRYGTDFFTSLFPRKREQRRFKRFMASLERLQDQLGALNDIATTPSLLDQLGLTDDPAASALLAPDKRKKLIAAALDAHEELIDLKRFWR